jgi:hypothetical protein
MRHFWSLILLRVCQKLSVARAAEKPKHSEEQCQNGNWSSWWQSAQSACSVEFPPLQQNITTMQNKFPQEYDFWIFGESIQSRKCIPAGMKAFPIPREWVHSRGIGIGIPLSYTAWLHSWDTDLGIWFHSRLSAIALLIPFGLDGVDHASSLNFCQLSFLWHCCPKTRCVSLFAQYHQASCIVLCWVGKSSECCSRGPGFNPVRVRERERARVREWERERERESESESERKREWERVRERVRERERERKREW